MNEWLLMAVGSAVAGVAVYAWQRHAAAKERAELDRLREEAFEGKVTAEREKSNAEVALAAKCGEIEQLRKDGVEDLERQAEQFREEIRALNARLDASEQKVREERERRAESDRNLVAAQEAQRANESMLKEKEESNGEL